MKEIPGIDAGGNPKNDPFQEFYKTGEPRGTGGFDVEEQKHGLWKRYHPNGQLWDEGRFRHGKKTGTWKMYNEEGVLVSEEEMK